MVNSKLKIFVSAFACLPNWGSESGVGWHWVLEMSNYFELWVLVHKEQVVDIEKHVKSIGLDKKIHFIYFDIPFNSLFFKNGKFRWVRMYYFFWTILSNKIVKRTMEENNIKIFHHLTFGNAIWGVSNYGQKQFFIWGPIGGVDTIPCSYTRFYDLRARLVEFIRRALVRFVKIDPAFKRRCQNSDLILCKSEYMMNAISPQYRDKAVLFTDVAVESYSMHQDSTTWKSKSDVVNYIMVGHLDAWRGFDLAIEAFSIAIKKDPRLRLTIVGNGIDYNRLIQIVDRLALNDIVKFTGEVTIQEYNNIISGCDVVLNPALKEAAVTVSFDCLKYGKPLICIDSKGYTRYFSEDYAIILPMQDSRMNMIEQLSQAVLYMADDIIRLNKSRNAYNAGIEFVWSYKGVQIKDAIISAYNNKQ